MPKIRIHRTYTVEPVLLDKHAVGFFNCVLNNKPKKTYTPEQKPEEPIDLTSYEHYIVINSIDSNTNKDYIRKYRKYKLEKWRKKRRRNWIHVHNIMTGRKSHIMYECRSDFAIKRPRVSGKFVKSSNPNDKKN